MAILTIQDLQDIAVKSTSEFFNDQISLNQSLAKQASDRGLNSEQLKRAVEATNTLTHLKSIELSKDRTVEFPVAEYKEIVKLASVPDPLLTSKDRVPDDFVNPALEKSASVVEQDPLAYSLPKMTRQELVMNLQKEAMINSRILEDLKVEREIVGRQYLEKVAQLRKDPELLAKLACIPRINPNPLFGYTKLAGVILGREVSPDEYRPMPDGMFKEAALRGVNSFCDLEQSLYDLTGAIGQRSRLDERWKEIHAGLLKEAFSLKPITNAIGSAASKLFTKAPAAPGKSFIEQRAAGVGNALGRTATAPIRIPAKVIGNTTSAIVGAGVKKVNNTIANLPVPLSGTPLKNTGLGKAIGLKEKPINPNIAKRVKFGIAATTTLGMAALDSTTFSPSVNPSGDRSGKVWDALQS